MVLVLFVPFQRLYRAIRFGLHDPEFRAVLVLATFQVAGATVFYWAVEDWSMLDSLYFSVVSVTTVGYGDYAPDTAAGKLFTIGYLVLGVGMFVAFVSRIATLRIAQRENALEERKKRRAAAGGPAPAKE